MEIWKDIPNYKGYQVSNTGKVRTHNKITYKRGIERHWKDKILKYKCINENAYKTGYRVSLWKNNKCKDLLVARLVAFTFYGKDINDKTLTVNHIDGNRLNNQLTNLEIISLKENIQHGFRTGLYDNATRKVKITNKITGSIILPRSLAEGCKMINKSHGYLSYKINQNIYENEVYRWELLCKK